MAKPELAGCGSAEQPMVMRADDAHWVDTTAEARAFSMCLQARGKRSWILDLPVCPLCFRRYSFVKCQGPESIEIGPDRAFCPPILTCPGGCSGSQGSGS